MASSQNLYEVRPRKDRGGIDLVSDILPFDSLWYAGPSAIENAIGYAKHYSRAQSALIRVYDEAGNAIQTHEHKGDFKEAKSFFLYSYTSPVQYSYCPGLRARTRARNGS